MYETYLQNEREFEETFLRAENGYLASLVSARPEEIKSHNRLSLIKVMKALEKELEEEKEMCDKRIRHKSLISPEDIIYGCEQGIQLSIDKIREFISKLEKGV